MAESFNAAADAKLWPDLVEKKFIIFWLEVAIKGNTPYNWWLATDEFNEQSGKSYSLMQLQDSKPYSLI